MNANNILFRASKTGALMTEARSKSEPISETTKSYLNEVFINEKYGIKKDIISKYIEKGLQVEEAAIKLYSEHITTLLDLEKNEQFFQNEFIKGTPDIINGNEVIDVKCSYDIFTFTASKTKTNKDYYWQLQSYMALTGCTSAKLVYCLIDTPLLIIEQEKKNLYFRMGAEESEAYEKGCEEIERLAYYNHLPLNERIYEIEIERNDEDIQKLYKRVQECREWMNKELFKVELLTA
jgi:ribosomal protein S16